MSTVQVVATPAGTTTTTYETKTKGNKGLSIVLIIFGALGLLLSLVAIIYSVVGANFGLEEAGVKNLQEKCAGTFAKTFTNGSWACADSKSSKDWGALAGLSGGTGPKMCGQSAWEAGCSYATHEKAFKINSAVGTGATIAGSFFVIIASICLLLNGLFGYQVNETAAKVSGGFAVGCSIPGLLAAAICAIVTLIATGVAHLWKQTLDKFKVVDPVGPSCTAECKAALDATATLGTHITNYYGTLTLMLVIMIILTFIESIMACVSCCFWKKQVKVTSQTAPAAAVVTVPAQVVESQRPSLGDAMNSIIPGGSGGR